MSLPGLTSIFSNLGGANVAAVSGEAAASDFDQRSSLSISRNQVAMGTLAMSALYLSGNALSNHLAMLLLSCFQSALMEQAANAFMMSASMFLAYSSSQKKYRTLSAMVAGFYGMLIGVTAVAPTVKNPIQNQAGDPGVPLSIPFRVDDVFQAANKDTLSIRAELSDGSPLPSWLSLQVYPQQLAYEAPSFFSTDVYVDPTGSRALVSALDQVLTYDLTNRTHFTLLNSVPVVGGNAWGVGMIPNRQIATVAAWSDGVQFYNASNLANLTHINTFDTPNLAHRVNYARMANTDFVFAGDLSTVVKINANNIPNLLDAGGYQQSTEPYDTAYYMGKLFVADGSGYRVLALNASTMEFISEHSTYADATGVTVMHEGKIVLVSTIGTVDAFNFENMTNPVLTDRLQLGWLYDIEGSETGSTAYAIGVNPHLINVDLEGKLSYLGGGPVTTATSGGVAVNGNDVFVSAYSNGFYRYDIAQYNLAGTPPNATFYDIKVIANNGHGGETSTIFRVNIGNVPEPTTAATTATTRPVSTFGTTTSQPLTSATTSSLTSTTSGASTASSSTAGVSTSSTGSSPFGDKSEMGSTLESTDLTWLWVLIGVGVVAITAIAIGVYLYRRNKGVADSDIKLEETSDTAGDSVTDPTSTSSTGPVIYTKLPADGEGGSNYQTLNVAPGAAEEPIYNTPTGDKSPHLALSMYQNADQALRQSGQQDQYENVTSAFQS